MTRHQQQFLELLRAGLWGTPADPANFQPGDTDWKAIMRIANEQTVLIIVADGIETLPQQLWPAKDTMLRLMMHRVKTAQMHDLLNTTLNLIVTALNAKEVPSVLLKGQGVAQNYRKPESRACGDIDLYTGTEGYTKACEIIDKLQGDKPHQKGQESEHHMHLKLNGVDIEVHRFTDVMPSPKLNKSLKKWSYDSIDAHFGTDALSTWNNNGLEIRLATNTFNAFFILHHAVRHMTIEGVGFRQLCDWTMYLHKHHASVNTEELSKKLKEYHMESIWEEFGILAITALGLPAEELPIAPASPTPTAKTEKLLENIFVSGNFGRFDTNARDHSETTYLKRKWRSFRYQSMRLYKLFNLFPRYSANYALNWFFGGIGRFFRGDKV